MSVALRCSCRGSQAILLASTYDMLFGESHWSSAQLNHGLPWSQTQSKVMQRTADFHD